MYIWARERCQNHHPKLSELQQFLTEFTGHSLVDNASLVKLDYVVSVNLSFLNTELPQKCLTNEVQAEPDIEKSHLEFLQMMDNWEEYLH